LTGFERSTQLLSLAQGELIVSLFSYSLDFDGKICSNFLPLSEGATGIVQALGFGVSVTLSSVFSIL